MLPLLLAAYNEIHPPFRNTARPADVVKHLLDQREMKQADLVPIIGSCAYLGQIVSGRRGINRTMAKKLAAFFNVKPSLFLD